MEGSDSDFKSTDHGLHHITRLHQWFSGGSRHSYRHPRGQAVSAASGLEGGGPVRDIFVYAQGV